METIEEVQNKMNKIYREYSELKIYEPNAGEIHKQIQSIINDVCNDISNNVFVDIKKYLGVE